MLALSSRLFLLPIALVGLWVLIRRIRRAHQSRFDSSPEAKHDRIMLWPFYALLAGFGAITITQLILNLARVSVSVRRIILYVGAGLGGALIVGGLAAALIIPFVIGLIECAGGSNRAP